MLVFFFIIDSKLKVIFYFYIHRVSQLGGLHILFPGHIITVGRGVQTIRRLVLRRKRIIAYIIKIYFLLLWIWFLQELSNLIPTTNFPLLPNFQNNTNKQHCLNTIFPGSLAVCKRAYKDMITQSRLRWSYSPPNPDCLTRGMMIVVYRICRHYDLNT